MIQDEARTPVLVLTGPVGVGKTAVGSEIPVLIEQKGVAHAMIDVDCLRWSYPRPEDDPFHIELGLRNLAAVWANYRYWWTSWRRESTWRDTVRRYRAQN